MSQAQSAPQASPEGSELAPPPQPGHLHRSPHLQPERAVASQPVLASAFQTGRVLKKKEKTIIAYTLISGRFHNAIVT